MSSIRKHAARMTSRTLLTIALLQTGAAGAWAAPSAPPCTPSGSVGVEARPSAYVVDYHFTGAVSSDWGEPGNWSYGSWAEEAAPNATVPAERPFTCLSGSGDTIGPFTAYPRVIIDAGANALIDAPISPIGELELQAAATLFVAADHAEFLVDFGKADIHRTLVVDGIFSIGEGVSVPLPSATIGFVGRIGLGFQAEAIVDADAVFSGTGTIRLWGGTIGARGDLTFNVDVTAESEKSEIRARPGSGDPTFTFRSYVWIDSDARLELGIGAKFVYVYGIVETDGQLFLRANETAVWNPAGTLIADTGTITTRQDSLNPSVYLTNYNQIFVKSGGTLATTGTPGYNAGSISFVNALDSLMIVEEGGLVTLLNPPADPVPRITNFGTIELAGEIRGNLLNGGTIHPGSSPGLATIDGDLTLSGSSTLAIELEGAEQGVDYDAVIVSGTATLGGILEVTVDDGFTPGSNDSFVLVEAAVLDGAFDTVVGAGALPQHYGDDRFFLGAEPLDLSDVDTSGWQRPVVGARLREEESWFCVDDSIFQFDLFFGMAETYDLAILVLSTDTPSGFSNNSEALRYNYYTASRAPDPRVPVPEVETTSASFLPPYEGPDRLYDGVVDDYSLSDLGNGFWRFRAAVPNGSEPFVAGDTLGSLGIRASQVPLDFDPEVDYDSRTNVYPRAIYPDPLTVVEAEDCARMVPEPAGSSLRVLSLVVLAALCRRRGAAVAT